MLLLHFHSLLFVLLHDRVDLVLVLIIVVWHVRVDPLTTLQHKLHLIRVHHVNLTAVRLSFTNLVARRLLEVFHLNSNLALKSKIKDWVCIRQERRPCAWQAKRSKSASLLMLN